MRYLLLHETELLKTIARIHESIPESYDLNYSVTDLGIQLRYESMKLLIKHHNDQIILIEENDQLCAFLWFHKGDVIHIKSTYVVPDKRNKGLASQLKREVETIAKENQIQNIYSDVDPENKKMRKLNEKLGYTSMGNTRKMIKIIEV